jgi:transketolase N-terminal domain/subunit
MKNQELAALALELRKKTVDVIVGAKAGHIGGDMSVMDVLVMLYFKHMNVSPENQNDPKKCRTQILLRTKNDALSTYLLHNSIGNHHIILQENQEPFFERLCDAMNLHNEIQL